MEAHTKTGAINRGMVKRAIGAFINRVATQKSRKIGMQKSKRVSAKKTRKASAKKTRNLSAVKGRSGFTPGLTELVQRLVGEDPRSTRIKSTGKSVKTLLACLTRVLIISNAELKSLS